MPAKNEAAFDFLAQRRSYPAKLMAGAIPTEAELRAILTVALRVPDHGKLEPWRLLVLEQPALARLADLAEARARELGGEPERIGKGRGQFDLGQLAVAVIASPRGLEPEKVPLAEQRNSAAALAFGIVIAATAAGWRANWLTGWVCHDRDFITRAFDCTEAETLVGLVHIGTAGAEEAPDRPRPALDRIASWVRL